MKKNYFNKITLFLTKMSGWGCNIKDIYKYVKYYTVEEEIKVMVEELGAVIIEAANEQK